MNLQRVQSRIRDFQIYVTGCYYNRAPKWPAAPGLIEEVADALTTSLATIPVNLEKIAQTLKLTLEMREQIEDGACGRIVPVPGGFRATIYNQTDSNPTGSRVRFTIAHECGHVLFFSEEAPVPKPIIPTLLDDNLLARREERLCDVFAGALLIPQKCLGKLIPDLKTMNDLFSLAAKFGVAPEVVVHRIFYGVGSWSMHVLYRLSVSDSNISVKTYRGRKRRRASDRAPSANALTKKLMGVEQHGMTGLKHHLERHLDVPKESIGQRGNSIWVLA